MSNVPGINARHAVITPTCRANRTDMGAFEEAVARLRSDYERIVAKRGEDGALYHIVLAVESLSDQQSREGS